MIKQRKIFNGRLVVPPSLPIILFFLCSIATNGRPTFSKSRNVFTLRRGAKQTSSLNRIIPARYRQRQWHKKSQHSSPLQSIHGLNPSNGGVQRYILSNANVQEARNNIDIDDEQASSPQLFENLLSNVQLTIDASYRRFYSAIDGGSTGWSDWVDDASRRQLLTAMKTLATNEKDMLWSWCKDTPDVMSVELMSGTGIEMRALVVPAGTRMTRHFPPGNLLLSSMLSGSCNVKSFITSKRQGVETTRETARHSYDIDSEPWMYYGGPQRVITCSEGDVAILLEIILKPPARLSPIYSEHTMGLRVFPVDNSTKGLEHLFTEKILETQEDSLKEKGRQKSQHVSLDDMRVRVGGLDGALSNITRRIFATRRFSPRMVEKLGLQHVRGMLLYGPPGCGKTLLAREIAKVLKAREPKIVSGPEILNKWVGEAEKSIRGLFVEAEREQREKGPESDLHVVVFDEMDAVCKVRGSVQDGGVRDSVVNQLLAKLDGVDQLHNLLVIGLTNRRELIDPALLRPGRFEVQMYVGLPDEQARQEILQVHMNKIVEGNFASPEVKGLLDSGYMAKETTGFSGAELAGLVRSAMSFAITRAETGDDVLLDASDMEKAMKEIREHLVSEADSQKKGRWSVMKRPLRKLGSMFTGTRKEQIKNDDLTGWQNY
eukprot:CAMPEP_0167755386 /NCGR_PEP_ID=MMETSP0110_2-20121227/8791_1 /TAXON_ID=629695 /ORGANISM="Gymnochlora sp., Strain CCMP2014" /LENGTH=659 /DNA_ID=CAMNT_0007641359 /DNA_START=107 /DNA_END=2086 /DNA_ORIENTATION=-